ncbi:hypothetical protein MSPP1_000792 [Malassezia sp. CBS 17886]|nr:hypothetical protein MSPP1_000792 [Malassezia sp. CBS 17886]
MLFGTFTLCGGPRPLSSWVPNQEKSCYHAWVDQKFEKVGFYFAVQEGGDFDIDYVVKTPSDRVVIDGRKATQEDIVFTANEFGEYSFCFENFAVSHGDKLVDFDITVESEPRLDLPIAKAALLSEKSSPVEESMSKLDSDLMAVERTLRYFRVRENNGFSLVETTRKRITRYSIVQALAIIAISAGQVFIVRLLFDKGASASRYRV